MTNDDKSRPSDADMRQAWRQASDERPPAELDRAVMRAARQSRARLTRWSQPLALAATLLIGVLLVYDTQAPLRGPEPAREDDSTAAAVEPAPARLAAPETGSDPVRRQKPAAKVAAPQLAEDFAQPAYARPDVQADADHPGSRLEEAEMAAPAATAARDARAAAKTESRACNAEARATANRWWQCIEELAAAGNEAIANAEKQRLQAAFPDFTVPE